MVVNEEILSPSVTEYDIIILQKLIMMWRSTYFNFINCYNIDSKTNISPLEISSPSVSVVVVVVVVSVVATATEAHQVIPDHVGHVVLPSPPVISILVISKGSIM